jgi:hypothetical protein
MNRKTFRVVLLAVLGFCLLTPCLFGGGCLLSQFAHRALLAAPPANNALCPFCGREFHIADSHTHDMGMWNRRCACPNCDYSDNEGAFLVLYDNAHPQAIQPPAKAKTQK